jgi:conjugative relaxase-like TrwC/TraI family protein
MIRMVQCTSAEQAEKYFSDALSRADYYINDQECIGQLQGKVADRLGIAGPATKELFHALCWNMNPATNQPLTPRTTENRTVYYDINFHCPKSVSIAFSVYGDDRILSAFQDSVRETMVDIESDMQTRVRKSGQNDNRRTGELLYSDFIHFTARPQDEETAPDPLLHAHCTTFNVTWDETEQLYKAGQFQDIKRDMPFYQERFFKRLSDRLMAFGYGIRKTRNGFEIENIPEQVIALFSKRTRDINRIAKEQNITNAFELDKLGERTRKKKNKSLSMAELKQDWQRQLTALEQSGGNGLSGFTSNFVNPALSVTAQNCIDHALLQKFERTSVAHDRRILAEAYKYGIGRSGTSIEAINRTFQDDKRIIQIQDGQKLMCTTHEVLQEEKRMVDLAKAGKGMVSPLYTEIPALTVAGDQATALTHTLTCTDRVTIIRGGAGTGKTTVTKEMVSLIRQTGINPVMVAPTANAARSVLREEGFAEADTVARLLTDSDMQKGLKNGCLIVDEAGLLGVKDLSALLQLVTDHNARLILIGDTRQHSSVTRGDGLRILNTVAGIKVAEVNKIYRQKHEAYRKAVSDLAAGNVKAGFELLDTFGAIQEIDPLEPHKQLVADYMAAVNRGKTALVVSPTHKQGEAITTEIRKALKEAGTIGAKETTATRYISLNCTEAEKADPRQYQSGMVVQFNQNVPGARRGSLWTVNEVTGNAVLLSGPTGRLALPLDKAHQFNLYHKSDIFLAVGDSIAITKNAFDLDGKRLNNGQSMQVHSIEDDNSITFINPSSKTTYRLAPEFGHIRFGYTTTSHASQGKTVDEVFISQGSFTDPAGSREQFYVSVSRARDMVHIYTDSKSALLEQITQSGHRQSALELVGGDELMPPIGERLANMEQVALRSLKSETSQTPSVKPVNRHAPKPVF